MFQKAHEAGIIRSAGAPRDFGAALLILGVLLLIGGIVHHIRFAMELRHTRGVMKLGGLVHADSRFPVSITFLVAVALLVIGLWAGLSIVLDIAPFA